MLFDKIDKAEALLTEFWHDTKVFLTNAGQRSPLSSSRQTRPCGNLDVCSLEIHCISKQLQNRFTLLGHWTHLKDPF